MSEILKSWKAGAAPRLLWIDFDAYAHTVFSSGSPEWLRDPVRRAGALEQAQRVVNSQVLTIDITAPCLAAAEPGAGDAAAVVDLLGADAPQAYLSTLLDAVGHRLAQRMDVVLATPSPRDLLIAAGAPADAEPSFNDLDDIGMALGDLARGLSSKSVHGFLLTVSDPRRFSADEGEAVSSLFAAVRHFGWGTAVATPSADWPPDDAFPDGIDADLVLYPQRPIEDIVARGERKIGGGLGDRFWSAAAQVPANATGIALYGTIPPALQPEQVLARLSTLAPLRA